MKSTLFGRIADKVALVGAFFYLASFIFRVLDLIQQIKEAKSEKLE